MNTGESTPTVVSFGDDVLERMVVAVENVRERLRRATAALEAAQIPYAVIGGNAVAAWVSQVDPGGARNTVDVDLMVNRADFPAVKTALEHVGCVHQELLDVSVVLDGPDGRPRDAVHLLFAGEKVRPTYSAPAPDLSVSNEHETYRLIDLEPLVQMKLTSFRRKDQVHLLDLIDIGLIDETWVGKFPAELGTRLQELIDDPDG